MCNIICCRETRNGESATGCYVVVREPWGIKIVISANGSQDIVWNDSNWHGLLIRSRRR